MPSRFHSLVVLLLSVANQLPAQAPARERGHGFVRAADGTRVAGAKVVVFSRALPHRSDLDHVDELWVPTGKDGMFKVDLLPGRAYSAWAMWQDDAGERRSHVVEDFMPGPIVALDEAPRQHLSRLRVIGRAAWSEREPLRLEVFAGGNNFIARRLDIGARATVPVPTVPVPTLPGTTVTFQVRGADGSLLGMAAPIPLATAATTEATLTLAVPKELRVFVVDGAGAPIAGATVWHGNRLGVTRVDGTLRSIIPVTNPLLDDGRRRHGAPFQLVVAAPGHQRTLLQADFDQLPGGEATVQLQPGSDLVGRVLGKGGSPVPGLTLLPDSYATKADDGRSGIGVPLQPTPIDAEGRFHFIGLHPQFEFRLFAWLDAEAARAAGMPLRDGIAVAPMFLLAFGRPPFAIPHDLGELRLDRMTVAQVQVRAADGAPVPGARLSLATAEPFGSELTIRCDRVGRLQLPLPAGTLRIGAWAAGSGAVTRVLTVPPLAGDPALDPLVLELSATQRVRGTVVDGDGKPVAGITVTQLGGAHIRDQDLSELTGANAATSEPTGVDGAFELVFPLADARYALRAAGDLAGVFFASETLTVELRDTREHPLRIVVTPWQPPK